MLKGNTAVHGILWMLMHSLTLSIVCAGARALHHYFSAFQLCFLTNAITVIILFPFVLLQGYEIKNIFKKSNYSRAVLGVGHQIPLYYAFVNMPLVQVSALTLTYPVFATIFGIIILKERVDITRKITLVVLIVGSLIVLNPSSDFHLIASLCAIFTAMIWGIMDVISKDACSSGKETLISMLFSVSIPSTIGAAILVFFAMDAPIYNILDDLPSNVLYWLVFVSIMYALSYLTIYRAFASNADIAVISSVHSTNLIFAALIGYFAFNEMIEFHVLIGSIIIVASAIYLGNYEYKLHIREKR